MDIPYGVFFISRVCIIIFYVTASLEKKIFTFTQQVFRFVESKMLYIVQATQVAWLVPDISQFYRSLRNHYPNITGVVFPIRRKTPSKHLVAKSRVWYEVVRRRKSWFILHERHPHNSACKFPFIIGVVLQNLNVAPYLVWASMHCRTHIKVY